jgi:serine/threonine-protein kinase ATR
MRWKQTKAAHGPRVGDQVRLERIESLLDSIPADLIARRAVDCEQYSRALFHLEPYLEHLQANLGESDSEEVKSERDKMQVDLQYIYSQINEPDGIEGISACLPVLDVEQQVLRDRKAGRWTSAQAWYEIKLVEEPSNVDFQLNLLTCLKESGQYGE